MFSSLLVTVYVPLALIGVAKPTSPAPVVLPPAIPTPTDPIAASDLSEPGCQLTIREDAGGDGTVEGIERLTYALDGRLTERLVWRTHDMSLPPYSTTLHEYDADNFLARTVVVVSTGSETAFEYSRDSAGRLVRDRHLSIEDDRLVRVSIQKYAPDGMILERLTDFGGDGALDQEIRYNRVGDRWRVTTSSRGASEVVTSIEWIDVDARGVFRRQRDSDGNGTIDLTYEFVYDRMGRVIQKWGGETLAERLMLVFEYGDSGVERAISLLEDGTIDAERTYYYDSSGRLENSIFRHHLYSGLSWAYEYSCETRDSLDH